MNLTTRQIVIPQLGEGLEKTRIIRLLKQPGEVVNLDDLLFVMETDKANVEIESAYEGILREWRVAEDEIVSVGACIGYVESAEAASVLSPLPLHSNGHAAPIQYDLAVVSTRPPNIPPRTRAYCRTLSISEAEMLTIPAIGQKLTTEDVDAYLSSQKQSRPTPVETGYEDCLLSSAQRSFCLRVEQSSQKVVPATIKRTIDWLAVKEVVEAYRRQTEGAFFSETCVLACWMAQAAKEHEKFRSVILDSNRVRKYDHVNIGVAVAMPDDDMITAVIERADDYEMRQFGRQYLSSLRKARRGREQAGSPAHLILSSMVNFEVIDAVPVLVYPAIATLFVGAPYPQQDTWVANLVLTFDHRVINGAGAARFLQSIVDNLK